MLPCSIWLLVIAEAAASVNVGLVTKHFIASNLITTDHVADGALRLNRLDLRWRSSFASSSTATLPSVAAF